MPCCAENKHKEYIFIRYFSKFLNRYIKQRSRTTGSFVFTIIFNQKYILRKLVMKILSLAIMTLCIYFSECKAGKISYSLCRLDAQADEKETPYNSNATCGLVGTRLIVKYEIQTQQDQSETLWSAEIKYLPENVLIRGSAPKYTTVPSAVVLNYYFYGATTLTVAKDLYTEYYNPNERYNFQPKEGGNFQYSFNLGNSKFDCLVANTELFKWEQLDEEKEFNFQTIITNVTALKNKDGVFPPYSAKGFELSQDVLNCITFGMRLLRRFGIRVDQDPVINQYLQYTFGKKDIAYPERFLEPLAKICSSEGGFVNLDNLSRYYNNEYYSNLKLRALLEPKGQNVLVIHQPHSDGSFTVKKNTKKCIL